MKGIKEKVTVSLDPELVNIVDREVRGHHAPSRSAIIEAALRLWRLEQQRHSIEQGVAAYYHLRTPKEQQEDHAWTRVSGRRAAHRWDE